MGLGAIVSADQFSQGQGGTEMNLIALSINGSSVTNFIQTSANMQQFMKRQQQGYVAYLDVSGDLNVTVNSTSFVNISKTLNTT